jgi:hypothetical protein
MEIAQAKKLRDEFTTHAGLLTQDFIHTMHEVNVGVGGINIKLLDHKNSLGVVDYTICESVHVDLLIK